MTPRYALVVFDWDGTLLDSAGRIVATVREAIAASGLPPRSPEQIRATIGLGLHEAAQALYPELSAAERQRLTGGYREAFVRTAGHAPAEPFAGAAEALARLERAGCLLAIATGKSRSGLRRDLEQAGLDRCFVGTRTVDDCPSKPHPAMVEELVSDCGVTAADTLVVGDTLFDLEMAANAGVDALGVSWGAHPPERLAQARPRGILQRFEDLDRWVLPAGARH
ncbi:MAG: HAD-IA family hydrolase [Halofilum sp. (in: g-proteobacteria)]|nr:HAD-IA family hydrolase [Halofilum sp. (in: g-proteobacteria)]